MENRFKLRQETEVDSGLEELQKLTASVPSFESFNISNRGNNITTYPDLTGFGVSVGLLSLPEISVAWSLFTENTIFDWHTHEQAEWIIVFDGTMLFTLGKDGKEDTLDTGNWTYIPPNIPHAARFPVSCRILSVTVPKSLGYPTK